MRTNTVRKETPATVIPFPEVATLSDRQVDNRIAKIDAIKAQIADLKAAQAALEDEVKAALGAAEIRETGKYIVTHKREVRHLLDRKRLDADCPGLYEEYQTRISETMKFNYKPRKGGKA